MKIKNQNNMTYKTTSEKQQSFYNKLKALLVEYGAELTIQDFSTGWNTDEKIVVDFDYCESEGTEVIPQLVLGRFEDGR
mgnify:FL=1